MEKVELDAVVVAVEGIPGAGKSRNLETTAAQLRQRGYRVEVLDTDRVVTSPIFKNEIKRLYHFGSIERTLLLFFLRREQYKSARAIQGLVDIIIFDRYWASTIAYDHYGHGVTMEVIDLASKNVLRTPDLTLYFTVPLEVARDRKPESHTLEDEGFMERVSRGYEAQRDVDPKHWVTLDGTLAIPEVTDACLKAILDRVPREIKKRVTDRNRETRKQKQSS